MSSGFDWLRGEDREWAIERIDELEAAGPEERARRGWVDSSTGEPLAADPEPPIGLCPECLSVLPDDGVCDDPECPDAS